MDFSIDKLRKSFNSGKTRSYEWRYQQLCGIERFLLEQTAQIKEALYADLRMCERQAEILELFNTICEVRLVKKKLRNWMRDSRPSDTVRTLFLKKRVRYEPLGVVLVLGAWNYPLQLCLAPMIGAIAAGNCCVLKPSEFAQAMEKVMAEILPKYLDPDCFAVAKGDGQMTSNMMNTTRFDYVFFTGSTRVGHLVMQSAAKWMCPVTLECGGKSPCIVCSDCDLKLCCKRLSVTKLMNCGQTCVAPDYVLCDRSILSEFLDEVKSNIELMYGSNPKESPDYGRIINSDHVRRLKSSLEQSIDDQRNKLVLGGSCDVENRYFDPTIVRDISPDCPLMTEEIFGPILPVIPYDSIQQALEFVNKRPKPLALYIFSNNKPQQEKIIEQTSSGTVCINDCMMQIVPHCLPFGGIGDSGFGKYHGHYSFLTFSNQKSIADHYLNFATMEQAMSPPFRNELSAAQRWTFCSITETRISTKFVAAFAGAIVFAVGLIIGHFAK